jgi:O-antigen/teichoic acid export membrane protein
VTDNVELTSREKEDLSSCVAAEALLIAEAQGSVVAAASVEIAVPDTIHRRVFGLFAANLLTLLVVGLSFLAYSRLLSPPEFGLYALGLSAATLLSLVLDGGLKTTIIKMESNLSPAEESSIAVLMMGVSVGLILLLLAAERPLLALRPGISQDARFIVLFVGIALLFYPFVTLPTARLERDLEYGQIAWIESLGTIVERGSPAILLVFTNIGIYSFVWALLASRVLRALILGCYHRVSLLSLSRAGFAGSLRHLREGAWIQAGTVSSVLRDNLHVLLIGPLFGKLWIGYYAWALQVCLVSSQIFAQISARVSLPLLAQAKNFEKRWARCLYQIKFLTMLTVPVLCGVWLILPSVNSHFFHGKWQPALAMIPLLFLRMIPGMATTPVGPLIMVQRGGAAFAVSSMVWTACEIAAGLLFVWAIGPTGLAWSYALIVWVGLWTLIMSLRGKTLNLIRDLFVTIVERPSLVFAIAATGAVILLLPPSHQQIANQWLIYGISAALVFCSYLLERDLRSFLIHEER